MSRIFGWMSCTVLSLCALAGCHPPDSQKTSQDITSVSAAPAAGSIEARFKQNPSPQRAYRVILNVADAPGPFAVIEGFAQYGARDCTYITNKIAGVSASPEKRIPVAYKKIDEHTYAGIVHTDAMQDEDYFGRGVCHWKLVTVSAQLRATGAKGETLFFASLSPDALLANKPQTSRHERRRYPSDPTIPDFPSSGLDPSPADSFALTFTSEAVKP